MLSIYIPALISLLNVDQQNETMQNTRLLSSSNNQRIVLHDQSLKKLTEIGPKYSEEFKQIMINNPSYSESLKSAIRSQQKKANHESDSAKSSLKSASVSNQPASIQLKVDISKYK